jgi:hypothetical protein
MQCGSLRFQRPLAAQGALFHYVRRRDDRLHTPVYVQLSDMLCSISCEAQVLLDRPEFGKIML